MASFPTVPAFVQFGGWDATTRTHPVLKMLETIILKFDASNKLDPQWYTADATFQKADGSEYYGLDEVLKAVEQGYAPFTSHYHEPYSMMCIETDGGYKMSAQAKIYGNLAGAPVAGESRVKDKTGKEWDVVVPGGYLGYYVKAENGLGIAIKRTEVTADGSVPMRLMLKRGLISAKDLGL
jgi:hypothetical protein